jgi:hypothetical protein
VSLDRARARERAAARSKAAGEPAPARHYAQGLAAQVAELAKQLAIKDAAHEALRAKFAELEQMHVSKPSDAAFVEVARLVLAETTFRRIWDRAIERAGEGVRL